jgi:hypothetical protein
MMCPLRRGRVVLRAAILLLGIVTVTAQTTLPLKVLGPTVVEITVMLATGAKPCSTLGQIKEG